MENETLLETLLDDHEELSEDLSEIELSPLHDEPEKPEPKSEEPEIFDDNTRAAELAFQSLTLSADEEAILDSVPDDEIPNVLPKSMRTNITSSDKVKSGNASGWGKDKTAKVLQALSQDEEPETEEQVEVTESRRRDVMATVKDKAVRSKRDMVMPDRKMTIPMQTKPRDPKKSYMCESERKPLNSIDVEFEDYEEEVESDKHPYWLANTKAEDKLKRQFGEKASCVSKHDFDEVFVKDTKNFHYLTHDKSFGYVLNSMLIERRNKRTITDMTKSDSYIYQVFHYALPENELVIAVTKENDTLHVMTTCRYIQLTLLSDLVIPETFHDVDALNVWFEAMVNAVAFDSDVYTIDHAAVGEFNPDSLRVVRYGVIAIVEGDTSRIMKINNVLFKLDFHALLDVTVRAMNSQTNDFSFLTSCFKE